MNTTSVHHHIFDTAIGPCGVAWNARGLVGVQLPEKDRAATERRLAAKAGSAGAAEPPPAVATVIADIQRYLAGEAVDFSAVAVDLAALDPYRRKLYETMRALAWGETTTYGELAKKLGATDWGRRARCRRGDGAQSGAGRDPLPPRAGGGRQPRRFLGAWRRQDQGQAARARRRALRRRPAPAGFIDRARSLAVSMRQRHQRADDDVL
jgi:O6-methylguanine-DNA--protein-cysteine methyltransferase